MNSVHEVVEAYLKSQRWHYQYHTKRKHFELIVTAGRFVDCRMIIAVTSRALMVMTRFPLRVPVERRQEAAEMIVRANFGLAMGAFEMDMDDGEVRFKVVHLTKDGVPSLEIVEEIVDVGLMVFRTYARAFLEVALTARSAAEAISAAEAKVQADDEDDDEDEGAADAGDEAEEAGEVTSCHAPPGGFDN
jgi:hypothetical protein